MTAAIMSIRFDYRKCVSPQRKRLRHMPGSHNQSNARAEASTEIFIARLMEDPMAALLTILRMRLHAAAKRLAVWEAGHLQPAILHQLQLCAQDLTDLSAV